MRSRHANAFACNIRNFWFPGMAAPLNHEVILPLADDQSYVDQSSVSSSDEENYNLCVDLAGFQGYWLLDIVAWPDGHSSEYIQGIGWVLHEDDQSRVGPCL